jgi:hypothetical protein
MVRRQPGRAGDAHPAGRFTGSAVGSHRLNVRYPCGKAESLVKPGQPKMSGQIMACLARPVARSAAKGP